MNNYGTSPEPRTVRMERVLPGPIERVWAFLTESDKRATWFAGGAMDLRVGGKAALTFHPGGLSPTGEPAPERYKKHAGNVMNSTITRVEPPRLLSFTFGDKSDSSEVTFELTPRGEDVLLVLTHRRLATREGMLQVSGGWHVHLDALVDRLAGSAPRPFWSRLEGLEAEYDARLPRD
jgi:uncharacterized protein YndB with AHSA1/START domain